MHSTYVATTIIQFEQSRMHVYAAPIPSLWFARKASRIQHTDWSKVFVDGLFYAGSALQ
jgi:hypothetical protein